YENSLPNDQADAEVVVNTAAAFARRGHEVVLLCPQDGHHPSTAEDVLRHFGVNGPLGVHVHRPPPWSRAIARFTTNAPTIERGRQHFTQIADLLAAPPVRDAEVIYTRHFLLALRAMELGKSVFFDHYRPFGDQIPPMQPLIRSMMAHPKFLGMVAHSKVAADAYRRLGMPDSMIEVRHNGFDPSRVRPPIERLEARARTGLDPDRNTVVYSGRVNQKKGLDVVLDLARRQPETHFVIVGSEGQGTIEEAAETLANVTIVGWRPSSAVVPYLYAADVLIIPPSSVPLQRFGSTVLPLKVFLYLAIERPILAGDTPDIREVLGADNACLVPAGDVDAADAALKRLWASKEEQARLSAGAAETAKGLTWDSRAERIERFLLERIEGSRVDLAPRWKASEWAAECRTWLRDGLVEGRWIQPGKAP
ncbi:MAG: glycosyltransferase, partial [Myxococcota bacterium]